MRYNNIGEVKQRATEAFEREYDQSDYPEGVRKQFYSQTVGGEGDSENVKSESNSASGTGSAKNSTKKGLDPENPIFG